MKVVLFVVCVLFGNIVCNPCAKTQSVDITRGELLANGSVIFEGMEYKKNEWYDAEEEGTSVRLGCPCISRVCVHRCCASGSMFLNKNCTEMELASQFNPTVYKGKEATSVVASERFFYIHQRPCTDSYLVDSATPGEELYLQEDGSLLEEALGSIQLSSAQNFCLELRSTNLSVEPRLVAGICYQDPQAGESHLAFLAYAIGLLLFSVPFLLATFLIYAFIPELRNLHGKCLMAYCGGLIVAYTVLAFLQMNFGHVGLSMVSCYVIAFIVYYSFQTSFFWLNVMCFDIWRTFSGYRGCTTNKRRENRRFMLYGMYAWGVPVVLTSITAGMQFGDLPDYIVTPGFGIQKCWFPDWTSQLVYFYGPVLALVVCNVTFFSVTAHRIRSIRQETAILKGADSSRSDKLQKDKQRYGLYLKLFMVMGVNWTLELFSFVIGGPFWYWLLTDLATIALGIAVFFIFVWKKKVRNLVRRRFSTMFGLPYTESDTRTSKWNTASSAPTEDSRISSDDSALRLKEMH